MAKPFTLNLILPEKTITLEADGAGQVWQVSEHVGGAPDGHDLRLSEAALDQLRELVKPTKKKSK